MKKQFRRILPFVLGIAMVFTACSEDDDVTPPAGTPTPDVTVTIGGEKNMETYSVKQGAGVTIDLRALSASGGGAKLKTISINQNGDNALTAGTAFDFVSAKNNTYDFSTNAEQNIKNAEDEDLSLTGTFTNITSNLGTTTYNVKVTDKDGVSFTRTFKITVYTTFATTKTGQIYHISGTSLGSYDLTNDVGISSANASTSDITNTDAAGAAFTGSFKVGSANLLTNIVKVPAGGYDYDNASKQEAMDVYAAGTPIRSVTNPKKDDMYIFNLTNGNYVVVKITDVLPTDNTCNCTNKGKMEFEYKKD